eukprot:CAMPEP_0201488614 /NCGR_PEP_ID=MMETSP0151_2-20130828/19273_1 /ASSEMBLY_ACC=CAM_ASM_000257 /TAXON_ID=200890 /ORGANISM="Paramoeba atlantica, Strain 621/1 / CCAP 1560/9" /LENGTH=393 /DNA_ID=CAMNT_0047873939 /DNA_START=20 /DNA_END=1201 /DNA_ORIENTATION=-
MAVCVSLASNSDLAAELVKFFHDLRAEDEDKEKKETEEKLLKSGNFADLLKSLVPDFALAFKSNTPMIEGGFNLFCCVLKDLKDSDALYVSLLEQVSLDCEDRPLLRLKLLGNIFNSQENPQVRFQAFRAICKLAVASKNPRIIVPQLSKLDHWLKSWNLSQEQTRELYQSISETFSESPEHQLDAYKYLLSFLNTFNGSDKDASSSASPEAAKAIVLAAKLLEIRDFDDIVNLQAIEHLKDDAKYGALFQLLEIFSRGSVHDYLSFEQKHGETVKSEFGLEGEDLLLKIRLLTLASIGTTKTNIPLAQISKDLNVTVDEVDLWILEGVKNNYLECKIDEVENVVIVRQAHHRLFGQNEWKALQEELHRAHRNLNQVGAALDKNVPQSRLVGK